MASGRDSAKVVHKPRLLSDNGSSYISSDLAEWLKDRVFAALCAIRRPWARSSESLQNLTPADIYFRRGQTILLERERIKRETIKPRRLQHQLKAGSQTQTSQSLCSKYRRLSQTIWRRTLRFLDDLTELFVLYALGNQDRLLACRQRQEANR